VAGEESVGGEPLVSRTLQVPPHVRPVSRGNGRSLRQKELHNTIGLGSAFERLDSETPLASSRPRWPQIMAGAEAS
jgi:hypothetical protein